jgi:hypothetical protein
MIDKLWGKCDHVLRRFSRRPRALSPNSLVALAVSYTASPLSGDGISIDVEYILPRRLGRGGPG